MVQHIITVSRKRADLQRVQVDILLGYIQTALSRFPFSLHLGMSGALPPLLFVTFDDGVYSGVKFESLVITNEKVLRTVGYIDANWKEKSKNIRLLLSMHPSESSFHFLTPSAYTVWNAGF